MSFPHIFGVNILRTQNHLIIETFQLIKTRLFFLRAKRNFEVQISLPSWLLNSFLLLHIVIGFLPLEGLSALNNEAGILGGGYRVWARDLMTPKETVLGLLRLDIEHLFQWLFFARHEHVSVVFAILLLLRLDLPRVSLSEDALRPLHSTFAPFNDIIVISFCVAFLQV